VRAIFAFAVTFAFVLITKKLDDKKFARMFMTKEFWKRHIEKQSEK
jgi:hypothetical protein